jgi:hypothetical protein
MKRSEKTYVVPQTTAPAEEWGERLDTGRQIARGAKTEGCVEGVVDNDVHDPRSGSGHCDAPDAGKPAGMKP